MEKPLSQIRKFAEDYTRVSLLVISIGVSLRVLYAINVDPLSGQDAPSYYPSALRILEHGLFADNISAPAFPVGYTWFVAAVLWFSGGSLLAVSLFQILIFAIALWQFLSAIEKFFGSRIAFIFCILICFSPAQITSVTLVMYEIPMMSLFMLGSAILMKSVSQRESGRVLYIKSLSSGLMFAVAIAMQPKILAAILAFIIAMVWMKYKEFAGAKFPILETATSSILVILILSLGPTSLLIRNYEAGNGLGLTQNYATNIFVGAQNTGVNLEAESCDQFINMNGYDNIRRSLCLQRAKFSNFREGLNITRQQFVNFWLPYIGELKFRGTWYHALDFRRLIPSYEYWKGKDKLIDQSISWVWVIAFVTLLFLGSKFSIELFGLGKSLILLFPIVSLWFVSISSYGESRYRLPVAFLYYVILAIAISELLSRLGYRKFSRNELKSF